MKAIKLSRKIHKWFALVIGIQLFLWSLSGFYMVAVNIDVVHGDMLVKNTNDALEADHSRLLRIERLLEQYPEALTLTLMPFIGNPVYLIESKDERQLVDASTAEVLTPLDADQAIQVAKYHYAGAGSVDNAVLIDKELPGEVRSLKPPIWRIDFNDAWGSSFYIDASTGQFASRRHTLWRIFDFLWMLHILDFDERENVNNNLLRVVSMLAVILGSSGVWLLFYSFRKARSTRG